MENILKINYSHNEYLEKYSHSKDITNQGYTFIDSNIFQKYKMSTTFSMYVKKI